jgi:DME family drug/metabolite transporter
MAGYLFVLFTAFCWGFIGTFSSIAFSEGIQPMAVAF